jgi:hypothetical protein
LLDVSDPSIVAFRFRGHLVWTEGGGASVIRRSQTSGPDFTRRGQRLAPEKTRVAPASE